MDTQHEYKIKIDNWLKNNNTYSLLDLSSLKLTELNNLPTNLKKLNCSYNNLTELNNLPTNLTYLDCSNNNLTELNNLPTNLKYLDCRGNKIKKIILPLNLEVEHFFLNNDVIIENLLELININSIDYDNFNKFYLENINKCFLKTSYPLNIKNINNWIDKLKTYDDYNLINFGYSISKTLKHISFVEFYDNLCKLGYKLNELLYNNKSFVYIYIPELKKSCLWVVLLIWKFINKNYNIFIVCNKKWFEFFNNELDFKIIYIDDCSYTGGQIVDTLNFTYKIKINWKEKLFIFLSYVSNTALNFIEQYNFPKPIFITNFPTYLDQLSQEEIKNYEYVIKNYPIYKNIKNNQYICNIYFDYKLADFISVFQFLYAYGQLPDNKFSGTFITGCENFYETNKYLYDKTEIDLQNIFKNICPNAFYKSIEYTINSLDVNNIYDIKRFKNYKFQDDYD